MSDNGPSPIRAIISRIITEIESRQARNAATWAELERRRGILHAEMLSDAGTLKTLKEIMRLSGPEGVAGDRRAE